MTVSDLITELQRYPAHCPVVVAIACESLSEIRADVSASITEIQTPILNVEHASTASGFGVAIVTG